MASRLRTLSRRGVSQLRAPRPTPACALRYNSTITPGPGLKTPSPASIPARDGMTGEFTALPDIEVSQLQVTATTAPKPLPSATSLVFGHTFTDHMLTIKWSLLNGWSAPQIVPYGPLTIEPSATVLHYAQTCFEGMKAYRNQKGEVTLFRPNMNMKRLQSSATRIALPTFNGDALLELIKKLVILDKHWIPQEPGYSLYVRPTLIGTQNTIGVTAPNEALLFVICSPVGPYYPQGFKPVPLYGTTEFIRAAPGGTGGFKIGANYAPGVVPAAAAARMGYAQNLWLHGPEHYLTEVGTMNLFVVFKDKNGATELVTPPLDGMILPGVTRDSVLAIARDHASGKRPIEGLPSDLVVTERGVTMAEVKDAAKEGRLLELFGSGTAVVISPVSKIGYMGEDVILPTGEDGLGPVSRHVWSELVGRQMGLIPSEWSVHVA